jgi:DNA-binding PucR family transcriptional regulator
VAATHGDRARGYLTPSTRSAPRRGNEQCARDASIESEDEAYSARVSECVQRRAQLVCSHSTTSPIEELQIFDGDELIFDGSDPNTYIVIEPGANAADIIAALGSRGSCHNGSSRGGPFSALARGSRALTSS